MPPTPVEDQLPTVPPIEEVRIAWRLSDLPSTLAALPLGLAKAAKGLYNSFAMRYPSFRAEALTLERLGRTAAATSDTTEE